MNIIDVYSFVQLSKVKTGLLLTSSHMLLIGIYLHVNCVCMGTKVHKTGGSIHACMHGPRARLRAPRALRARLRALRA